MSARLQLFLDPLAGPGGRGLRRYTEDLARSLVEAAPRDCTVEGFVSALPPERITELTERLPGLSGITRLGLPRRELTAAWQLGLTPGLGSGMFHSPGPLGPLKRHDRRFDQTQIVVTIHDTLAWSHPSSLTPATVAAHKTMLKRARKHADAVVVPSHAVAQQLTELADFGDRVRVIGHAPSTSLALPLDAGWRRGRLGLPEKYLLTLGTLDPRRGLVPLITALGLPGAPDLPLVVLGPESWGRVDIAQVADEAGLDEGRVIALGEVSDADLAVVYANAEAFIYPTLREGFGLPVLEAFGFDVPVIHSDDAALREVAGGAGITVESSGKGYPERLAAAMEELFSDDERRAQLVIAGSDRARAYTWQGTAEHIWQLHADL